MWDLVRSVGLGAQSVAHSRLRQRLGPLRSARPPLPPRAGCPRSRARAYKDPDLASNSHANRITCVLTASYARKPDHLRVGNVAHAHI